MDIEAAKKFAAMWNDFHRRGCKQTQLAQALGIYHTTLYPRRRKVEALLGIKLPTMVGDASTASRVKGREQPDIQAPVSELDSLRREVRELRNVSADLAAIKKIVGTLDAKIATDAPAWARQAPKGGKLVHGTPTLMLSDLHFGETVTANEVNGVNSYSTEIAKRRLRRVVDGSVKLLRETLSPGAFGGMVVVFGGDMVEGVIHDEIRDTVDETVMQAVITLHDELVAALKTLADEFERIHVPAVAGNHGRLDRKPRAKKGPQLNFDWLLYQFVTRTIQADPKYRDRITFQVPDGYECSYRVHGVRYMLTHGDAFKGGNGITGPLLPWMRGSLKAGKVYNAIGKPFDCMVMGHWHQLTYLRGIIVNGSLVGYNEYAMRNHFEFEAPKQALWLTHPVRGITFQEGIFADDAPQVRETAWVEVPRAA